MARLIFDDFQLLKAFCFQEKLVYVRRCYQDDERYMLKFSSLQRRNAIYERIASKQIIQTFTWWYMRNLLCKITNDILFYYFKHNIKLMKNVLITKSEIETYECILN